jgi:hypothetical protein
MKSNDRSIVITTVGVPTRDRTSSLERCLAALADSCAREGRAPDVVVTDDTAGTEGRTANRAALRSFKNRYAGAIFYADADRRAAYADRLAAHSGLDPADVRFALANDDGYPIATGAGRNALLLHAAGEALLQIDDDVIASPSPAPGARQGVAVSPRHDPTEFWFPADDPSDVAAPAGLLALHEQLLGKKLQECGSAETLAGRVRLTAAGLAGDPGMSSPQYFLVLDGGTRDRFLADEATYRRVMAGPRVMRSVVRPTVCPSAFCMAANLGVDGRTPLPPFMPVQRNQDGVFGALVRACQPATLFGFLPWLLPHRPPTPRGIDPDDMFRAAGCVRSDQVVQLLIRAHAPRPGIGLRSLGEALAAAGRLPEERFSEMILGLVRAQTVGFANQLAAILDRHCGRPEFWAADVRRLIGVLRDRAADPEVAVPVDLARHFGGPAAIPVLQKLVGRFGRLLQCWDGVWQAALELRSAGVRPAEPA